MVTLLVMSMMAAAAQAAPADPVAPAAAAPATAPAAVAPGDKIRCKRYTDTGTLAHVTKECHTVTEWHVIEENARRNVTRYMDDGAIRSGVPH